MTEIRSCKSTEYVDGSYLVSYKIAWLCVHAGQLEEPLISTIWVWSWYSASCGATWVLSDVLIPMTFSDFEWCYAMGTFFRRISVCTFVTFDLERLISRSRSWCVITASSGKVWPSRHSRSLESIRKDRLSDFLLLIISNHYIEQEAQLMLTNPRDAFTGQSRSPNIVPFHMLGIVSSCAKVTLS